MDSKEAKDLRKQWGAKHCDHPDIIAERGTTEDKWRCVQCGRLVDFDEWESSEKKGPRR
jgi:hypothetical protein